MARRASVQAAVESETHAAVTMLSAALCTPTFSARTRFKCLAPSSRFPSTNDTTTTGLGVALLVVAAAAAAAAAANTT